MDDGIEVWTGRDPAWGGDDFDPPSLVFVQGPGTGLNVLRVDGMTPGFPVALRSSPTLDSALEVAGCSQPTPLGLLAPAQLRDLAVPDPGIGRPLHGVALLRTFLPAAATGTLFLVAVQPDTCRVTNTVSITLP